MSWTNWREKILLTVSEHRPEPGHGKLAIPEVLMYFRVATIEKDSQSHQNAGVFQRAYDLYYGGELCPDEECHLLSLLLWFERNLTLPDRSKLHRRAIFWFKADAGKVARRVWDLALALKEHGPPTEILNTRRPGYIVYEDDQQLAAIPFRDTIRACKLRRRPH